MGGERGAVELLAELLLRPALRSGQPQRRPDLPLVLRPAASEEDGAPPPPTRRRIILGF